MKFFWGFPKKRRSFLEKKTYFFIIFRILKNLILFKFDRRFFGASEKMDGHFLKKLILIIFFEFWKILFRLILTVVVLGLPKKWTVIFYKKIILFFSIFFLIFKNLICLILTVVFLGLPKKRTVIFRKNIFVYFFRFLKNLIFFNFERNFFGASQKKDGRF
jgi:hypothetical protein